MHICRLALICFTPHLQPPTDLCGECLALCEAKLSDTIAH